VSYARPSTLVRVSGDETEILRVGPVPESEILRASETMNYLEVANRA